MDTKEKKEAILKARSEKLAQTVIKSDALEGALNVLLFSLSGEIYGIESRFVDEVYPVKELVSLPSVPNFVSGLIQVRRKVFSIIDLRHLFGIAPSSNESNGKAIILKGAEMSFGLWTNEVLTMRWIPLSDLQPALPSMQGVYLEFIKGITNDRVVVLDGDKLLNTLTLVVSETK